MTVLNERPDLVVTMRRYYEDKYITLADLELWRDNAVVWHCVTLEPPGMENCPFLSRIPAGWYPLRKGRFNAGGYDTWEIHDVPGQRSNVKFHAGNYFSDTDGCPLLGSRATRGDLTYSVADSKATHAEFMRQMGEPDNPVLVVFDHKMERL